MPGYPAAVLALLGALVVSAPGSAEEGPDKGWPQEYAFPDGSTLLLYQPQLEAWEDFQALEARVAFSYRGAGEAEEILGGVRVAGDTETDMEARKVVLSGIRITDSSVPGLEPAKAGAAVAAVKERFPTGPVTIELDRLLANLEREEAVGRLEHVPAKPPRLFTSDRDAVLVLVDGEPILEPVEGTGLMAVSNTPSDLFWHTAGSAFYLRVEEGWMSAFKLEEAWEPSGTLPDDFAAIPDTPGWGAVREAVPGRPYAAADAPNVFASTEPAELVVFDGRADFATVPGTGLYFATNTESDVFLHGIDGEFYFLIAGRWFQSRSLEGPLTYAGDALPEDFSRIPPDHAAGRVLASVPGTQQAREAALAAQIPHKARVDRKEATVEVTYDGEPQFETIPGTEVAYAVNTSLDVFRVGGSYYMCFQGVWFVAAAPTGPWSVADEVPEAIYTIPPTSPKYHVTHTYVYDSTPVYVESGYDAGYLGAFVVGGLLVYGLLNADYVYVRACTGYCRPYYRHYHRYYRARAVHHRRDIHRAHHRHVFRHQIYGHGRHYDHRAGRYARSHTVRRHHAAVQPYRGPHAAWGSGTVRRASVANTRPQASTRTRAASTRVRSGVPDMYSGADGNIYRRQDGRWERWENGRWRESGEARPSRAYTPPAPAPSRLGEPVTQPRSLGTQPRAKAPVQADVQAAPRTPPRSLETDSRARTQGAARASQFQGYQQSRQAGAVRRGGGRRR